MQIMYGNAVLSLYTIFQDQTHIFSQNAPFFHFILFLLYMSSFKLTQQAKLYSFIPILASSSVLYNETFFIYKLTVIGVKFEDRK